jgi:hypothetical protein
MDPDGKTFFRDKVGIWGLVAAIGAWLFCVLIVVLYWNKLPPQLPFFYSLPWGETWLLAKEKLIWVLSGFALIFGVNLFLARTVVRNERLLQNFLIWGAATAEFMLAVDLIKIIGLIM